jgi:methenyltetrahydromethanopterin cyclohydrolase
VAKKRISSVDLNWIIIEQMRERGDFPYGLSIAVIADSNSGWRVVVAKRSATGMNPKSMRQLAAIEKQLQAEYALSAD